MVAKHFSEDRGAAGVFAIITAIMMMLISLLAAVNAVFFYKRDWFIIKRSSLKETIMINKLKINDLSVTFSFHFISYYCHTFNTLSNMWVKWIQRIFSILKKFNYFWLKKPKEHSIIYPKITFN